MTHSEDWLNYLYGRINYEQHSPQPGSFKLNRMKELLQRMGNPQNSCPILHVAGSKGKGSTAFMVASILAASGRRTGLYTSPHLHHLTERIRLDGIPCSTSQLCDLIRDIQPIVEEMDREGQWGRGPTFFEITTALAFQHFCNEKVDAAVIEVGLGGRLDSTNVCHPAITVITSISLDHTQLLGDTIEEIAAEKAGIIKAGVPLICGCRTTDPANPVIAATAAENQAPSYFCGSEFEYQYRSPPQCLEDETVCSQIDFHWHGKQPFKLTGVDIPLLGRHQAANAAVALATVAQLSAAGWPDLGEKSFRTGLANVRCAGRIEVVKRNPLIIVDSAHNVASVQALCDVLRDQVRSQNCWLIFGTSQDKDAAGMLRILLPEFERVLLTRYQTNPRAADPAALLKIARSVAPQQTNIGLCEDPHEASQQMIDAADGGQVICVAGSFYLVAEIRQSLMAQRESFAI